VRNIWMEVGGVLFRWSQRDQQSWTVEPTKDLWQAATKKRQSS